MRKSEQSGRSTRTDPHYNQTPLQPSESVHKPFALAIANTTVCATHGLTRSSSVEQGTYCRLQRTFRHQFRRWLSDRLSANSSRWKGKLTENAEIFFFTFSAVTPDTASTYHCTHSVTLRNALYPTTGRNRAASWLYDAGRPILDRLVHGASKFKLKGESLRKRKANLTADTDQE